MARPRLISALGGCSRTRWGPPNNFLPFARDTWSGSPHSPSLRTTMLPLPTVGDLVASARGALPHARRPLCDRLSCRCPCSPCSLQFPRAPFSRLIASVRLRSCSAPRCRSPASGTGFWSYGRRRDVPTVFRSVRLSASPRTNYFSHPCFSMNKHTAGQFASPTLNPRSALNSVSRRASVFDTFPSHRVRNLIA